MADGFLPCIHNDIRQDVKNAHHWHLDRYTRSMDNLGHYESAKQVNDDKHDTEL